MTQQTQEELDIKLRERFKELPPVVQGAITSTEVSSRLRTLAGTHQLHFDLWQLLENEVILTMLGLQEAESLPSHLKKDLELTDDAADALASDISKTIFEPIREQLERELGHPAAKEENGGDIEAVRREAISQERQSALSQGPTDTTPTPLLTLTVQPGTPPSPPPTQKAARGPDSGAYKSGEISTERKTVHDDPYRETP